jgi:hypothetical protein
MFVKNFITCCDFHAQFLSMFIQSFEYQSKLFLSQSYIVVVGIINKTLKIFNMVLKEAIKWFDGDHVVNTKTN